MKTKKPKPRTGPKRQRWQVSVSRETYRLIQGAAIARGTTGTAVVEQACAGEWCDLVAEKAGI